MKWLRLVSGVKENATKDNVEKVSMVADLPLGRARSNIRWDTGEDNFRIDKRN